jgi:hypothetical protein
VTSAKVATGLADRRHDIAPEKHVPSLRPGAEEDQEDGVAKHDVDYG